MGQKVHPYGFRLGTLYGWKSELVRGASATLDQVLEDHAIRKHIKHKLYHAGISKVVIDRTGEKCRREHPYGPPGHPDREARRRGRGAARKELGSVHEPHEIFINIKEIRKAELDAQLVAENIALQLERRVAFRRAMKKCDDRRR